MAVNSQDELTKLLDTEDVEAIGKLAAEESQRIDGARDYVAERIMRRLHKRIAKRLYELPLSMPAKPKESGRDYARRLYDMALAKPHNGSK